MKTKNITVSVVGLGYVGLPVAVAFGKKRRTIGFDINARRVADLKAGSDKNKEVSTQELKSADILFTSDIADLKKANFHIVAVPTPVDNANVPDMGLVLRASETVSREVRWL